MIKSAWESWDLCGVHQVEFPCKDNLHQKHRYMHTLNRGLIGPMTSDCPHCASRRTLWTWISSSTFPTCEIRDIQICCSNQNCYSKENILSRSSLISLLNNIASPFRDGKAKENSYKCLVRYSWPLWSSSVPNARRFALCCHLLV